MNYIKQLQQDNAELKERLAAADQNITYILTYLNSSKFQGVDNNYVDASEMFNKLMDFRSNL